MVANERMQRVDDDVDGFADEELARLAFTVHPYRWPTIGWMEDIRAMALDDVRASTAPSTRPTTRPLVVVGDVDEAQLLDLVERHYGAIEPAELPAERAGWRSRPSAASGGARFAKPTAAPRLLVGYRAVARTTRTGRRSRSSARCCEPGRRRGCTAGWWSSARWPRRSTATWRRSAIRALFRIAVQLTREHRAGGGRGGDRRGARPTWPSSRIDDERDREGRSVVETDFWTELEGVDGRAEALGHYQTDARRLPPPVRRGRRAGPGDAGGRQRAVAHLPGRGAALRRS